MRQTTLVIVGLVLLTSAGIGLAVGRLAGGGSDSADLATRALIASPAASTPPTAAPTTPTAPPATPTVVPGGVASPRSIPSPFPTSPATPRPTPTPTPPPTGRDAPTS